MERGGGRCRFLGLGGTFGSRRSCTRTAYLHAKGTTSWSYSRALKLGHGSYRLYCRAVDRAGNVERSAASRNSRRLTVR